VSTQLQLKNYINNNNNNNNNTLQYGTPNAVYPAYRLAKFGVCSAPNTPGNQITFTFRTSDTPKAVSNLLVQKQQQQNQQLEIKKVSSPDKGSSGHAWRFLNNDKDNKACPFDFFAVN